MKITVVGAGAIGGWIGARLSSSGQSVAAFARMATLNALQKNGWYLQDAGGVRSYECHATDRAEELGHQDLVIIAVKGQALPELAPRIAPLVGPETIVVPAMNGVPWWFLSNGPLAKHTLQSVDPRGDINTHLPAPNVLGCVVHASCSTTAPGQVLHKFGNDIILGEPSGPKSERLARVAALFTSAGFNVTPSERIRNDIWYKLWGNMSMNPISVVTGANCEAILNDPLLEQYILQLMQEAVEIGRRIGCVITESGASRNAVTRKLGAFKTSMLQDAEAGRSLELDALLSAPVEIARLVDVPTPGLSALLGLARVYGRAHGVYPS